MKAEEIWGVIRTILSFGSGYIAATGIIDATTYNSVIGALGVLFVAGWSIFAKRKAGDKAAV